MCIRDSYYTIDTIHAAISADRQVQFLYGEWTMEKKHRYRHGGKVYQVSPYALVWDDENYYLVAWDGEAGAIKHYRACLLYTSTLLGASIMPSTRCSTLT